MTFYFHKVAYVHYLGEVDNFYTWAEKFLPLYNGAKVIKIDQDFKSYDHKCTATFFMVHSVYISSQHHHSATYSLHSFTNFIQTFKNTHSWPLCGTVCQLTFALRPFLCRLLLEDWRHICLNCRECNWGQFTLCCRNGCIVLLLSFAVRLSTINIYE